MVDAPCEIKIVPLGKVNTTKGDFIVDNVSVNEIISTFHSRKIDIVIDYEHQTLLNVQAPAAGWIKNLNKGEDAIVASVEWTEKAREYLKNKEYRYLSPVVLVRKSDNRAIELQSVALTNTPAINGMFAVCKDNSDIEEEMEMNLKELAKLLGLQEDATEDDVKAAIEKIRGNGTQSQDGVEGGATKADDEQNGENSEEVVANSTILGLLGMDKGASTADVAAKIMSLSSKSNVEEELLELKAYMAKKESDELVKQALKDGKITPAQEEWARSYALSDKKGFEKFVEKAPKVVPTGKMSLSDAPASETVEYDKAILKNCGVSDEDVKKFYTKGDCE